MESFDLKGVEGETLSLAHPFLFIESEKVYLIKIGDSLNGELLNVLNSDRHLLERDRNYTIEYDRGFVVVDTLPNLQSSISNLKLEVHYDYFPFQIREGYSHQILPNPESLQSGKDTSNMNLQSPISNLKSQIPPSPPPTPSTLFLSGSKSLGISFGSDKDLSLDQSLRVNITGRVEDVEVNAVLSDENIPIDPEGTTETLEELEEVLVEIKSEEKGISATLGDFSLSLGESEFGRVERRLQGGMARARIGATGLPETGDTPLQGSVLLSGALSRGKFATNRFFGMEGRQGPYPLVGAEGEQEIVVIAGSEKVYLDEILLVRGERNGYTIDYGTAEISFTPRSLITSRSRILVEFEYSVEEFRRSLYGGRGTTQFGVRNAEFTMGTTFLREGDLPDSPLGVGLTDMDRIVLSNAGDDTSKAWVQGWEKVNMGEGDYNLDSLDLDGDPVFRFEGFQLGEYLITFTDVGMNSGKYEYSDSLNGFQYLGSGNGRYIPYIRLPLPSRKSFLAFDLSGEIKEGVEVKGEVSGSERDFNVLSSLNDEDNLGKAGSISLDLKPEAGLLPRSWGNLSLKGKFRTVDERFEFPGRGRDLQYEDRWNVREGSGEESMEEGMASYSPFKSLTFSGEMGRLRKENATHTREGIGGEWVPEGFPSLAYQIGRVESSQSRRTRQNFKTDYSFWKLKPQFTFFQEDSTSFRFRDYKTRLDGNSFGPFTGYIGGSFQKEELGDSSGGFETRPYSTAKTGQMGVLMDRWRSLSGGLDYTHREKDFTDGAGEDVIFDLTSLRFNLHPSIETRVEVTSTEARLDEERFYQVEEGEGDYSRDSLTGEYYPDPEGNFRREILPIGDFEPVHRLLSSLRLDHSPDPRLRLEGYASLDEERRDSKFLDPFQYQNDERTLQGKTNLEGDITLYPEKDYSLRLRLRRADEEDNMIQSLHKERLNTEEAIQLRSQALKKTVWTFEVAQRRDDESSLERGLERVSREKDLTGEITYKPTPRWEPSLEAGYNIEDIEDFLYYGKDRITSRTISPGLLYHLLRSGRVSLRMKFTDRDSKSEGISPSVLLFSPIGLTTESFLDFDYRLNEYITARVSYTGKWEPDRDPLHTASSELRAYF